MAELFDLDAPDLINLEKFYRRSPAAFRRTAANVLNSFAFGTQTEAKKVIARKMIVRNKRFLDSVFRVQKTHGGTPIADQQAAVGSIRKKRFSGWEEQQTGKKRASSRVGTLLSRQNTEKKQILPRYRMKSGQNFLSPNKFKGNTKSNRTISMLRDLKSRKFKKPFVIGRKYKNFRPGLYRFYRGKIRRLQSFKSKKAQPKRFDWMGTARRHYFKKYPVQKTWNNSIKFVLKLR